MRRLLTRVKKSIVFTASFSDILPVSIRGADLSRISILGVSCPGNITGGDIELKRHHSRDLYRSKKKEGGTGNVTHEPLIWAGIAEDIYSFAREASGSIPYSAEFPAITT